MKRAFDVCISLLAIILLWPVLLACAVAVRLSSKGPVFHVSIRVGVDNSHFRMLKFRTMRVNTPQLATHLMRNPDEYLTGAGRFLRQTSLDELPQLINVMLGDMSLVGPRPALFNQNQQIRLRTQSGCHRLVPGITGWAQTHGRDDISVQRKVELDTWYLHNRSFKLDLKILWVTLRSVLSRSGVSH